MTNTGLKGFISDITGIIAENSKEVVRVSSTKKSYVDAIQSTAHKEIGVEDENIVMSTGYNEEGSTMYMFIGGDEHLYTELKYLSGGDWVYIQRRL